MTADPTLLGFGQALMRALAHPAIEDISAPAGRQAVNEAWYAFRGAGGDRGAIALRYDPEIEVPGPWIERWQEPAIEIGSALSDEEHGALVARLADAFAMSGTGEVVLLPGVTPEEISAGIVVLYHPVEHSGLDLISRRIFRMMAVGSHAVIPLPRRVSAPVLECLDVLYVILTAISRYGSQLGITPNDLVQLQVGFPMARLEESGDIRDFMACLDVAAGHLPPRSQQGLLRLLAAMVRWEHVNPIIESCDRTIQAAGGASAVEDAVDDRDIPLAGHWLVAAALRERIRAAQGPWQGYPGRSNTSRSGLTPSSQRFSANPPAGGWPAGAPGPYHQQPAGVPVYHPESGLFQMPQAYGPQAGGTPAQWDRDSHASRSGSPFPASQMPDPGSGLQPLPNPDSSPGARVLDERTGDWLATYRKMGASLLARAEDSSDLARYAGVVRILSNVGASLLDSRAWAEALPIVRFLKAQEVKAGQWPPEQRNILSASTRFLLPASQVRVLVEALAGATPAARGPLFELIAYYGAAAVPALLTLYLGRKLSVPVRAEVVAAIESTGPAAGPPILEALGASGRDTKKLRSLLGMIGAVGYRAGEQKVATFLRHQQAGIRDEAIVSLYKLLEQQSKRYLVGALDDANAGVVQKAVALLAAMRSRDPNFVDFLHDVVSIGSARDTRDEGLIISAILALGELGNIELAQGVDAEGALVDALRDSLGGGILSFMGGGKGARSLGIQLALCEALGGLGSARAKGVLQQIGRESSADLQRAAQRALGRIAARLEAGAAG